MNDLWQNDTQARKQALEINKSFIIQAPAGSGKTELLIQRFLSLLVSVNRPEEILAITFTKKAATEMRHRIVNALINAKNNIVIHTEHERMTRVLAKKVLVKDNTLLWHIVENPNQLKIQTIDSFCSALTQQLPILSHLGYSPDIATDATLLYEKAALATIMQLENDDESSFYVKKLLYHLDNDFLKLQELISDMLSKRDQWLPYIYYYENPENIRHLLQENLSKIIEETLSATKNLVPKIIHNDLLAITRFAAGNLNLIKADSPLTYCDELTQLPGDSKNQKKYWLGIAKLLLTQKFEFRKRTDGEIGFPALDTLRNQDEIKLHKIFRAKFKKLLTVLEKEDALKRCLKEIILLPEATYENSQWEILHALFHLLKFANAQLRLIFHQYGKIDFIENSHAALMSLGDIDQPTNLLLSLDYQIKHILIDEFQDTSHTQYKMLEKLIAGWQNDDGKTLFIVGDPMQSIYRFREADVSLFTRMFKNSIGNITLTPLKLSLNFRSSQQIVSWNNKIFKNIFPEKDDISLGAVSYSESVAGKHNNEQQEKDITITGFLNHDELEQANQIKDFILSQFSQHPTDSIAILVRSRSHLKHIIKVLKKNNINYQAIDIDPLDTKQHIQDLLSLTRALINPADKLSWLAVLRAPWCCLTLKEMFLLHEFAKDKHFADIFYMDAAINLLSNNSSQMFQKFSNIIKSNLALKMRLPFRDWIENTWLQLGGPAYLDNVSDLEDTHIYFSLLEKLELTNEFNLESLNKNVSQLYATNQTTDARLQIMTIHAAKGLEFDTVILPQLDKKNPASEKSLMISLERALHNNHSALMLAPIHAVGTNHDKLYQYIQEQNKIKSSYEIDRLLYVATSRAKKRLFLSFNAQYCTDIKIPALSILNKMWPYIKNSPTLTLNINENKVLNLSSVTPLRPIKKIPVSWVNPIQSEVNFVTLHHLTPGFNFKFSHAKTIGVIIHRLLQQIANKTRLWWQEMSNNEKNQLIKSKLLQNQLPLSEIEAATNKVSMAISNTLSDERGIWILENHKDAEAEYSLSVLINEKIENIIIDRTFIDEHNNRWIIDYKSTIAKTEINEFLASEQKKYQEKMAIYHTAFMNFENRPIKLGLYFPLIPAWHEWMQE